MHPDADAFLDAIFANPDDDLPRLVYADWLEEHGQANYAGFIRASCEIEQVICTQEERKDLRRQRHHLWEAVKADYPAAFEGLRLTVNDFPRGICQGAVELSVEDFVRTSPNWWPVICPRALTLTEPDGHEIRLTSSAYLAHAESVTLKKRRDYDQEIAYWSHQSVYDHGLDSWAHQPIAELAVWAVVSSPWATRLRGLRVDCCRASAELLSRVRDSELIGQLGEFRMGVRFDDETDGVLDAHQSSPGNAIRQKIDGFLRAYGRRLVSWPLTDFRLPI